MNKIHERPGPITVFLFLVLLLVIAIGFIGDFTAILILIGGMVAARLILSRYKLPDGSFYIIGGLGIAITFGLYLILPALPDVVPEIMGTIIGESTARLIAVGGVVFGVGLWRGVYLKHRR